MELITQTIRFSGGKWQCRTWREAKNHTTGELVVKFPVSHSMLFQNCDIDVKRSPENIWFSAAFPVLYPQISCGINGTGSPKSWTSWQRYSTLLTVLKDVFWVILEHISVRPKSTSPQMFVNKTVEEIHGDLTRMVANVEKTIVLAMSATTSRDLNIKASVSHQMTLSRWTV